MAEPLTVVVPTRDRPQPQQRCLTPVAAPFGAEVRGGHRRRWGPRLVWRLGALAGFLVAVVRRL